MHLESWIHYQIYGVPPPRRNKPRRHFPRRGAPKRPTQMNALWFEYAGGIK